MIGMLKKRRISLNKDTKVIEITPELVRELVDSQFSQWQTLPILPVAQSGHDNRTFHLGETMTVRLPSSEQYVAQVEKEAKWLPFLASKLALPIATPLTVGVPSQAYPFPWSVNAFIEGETLTHENVTDMPTFATDLANFLQQLQNIKTTDAPVAGAHNFYRGASPKVYDEEVKAALKEQAEYLPIEKIEHIWEQALATEWEGAPVWIHGDVAPGNLLVKNGVLCGVIDFGIMGVGDPACDYAMAWTFFNKKSRQNFLAGLDCGTINRARSWALWKALITLNATNPAVAENAKYTLNVILNEADETAKSVK